MAMTEYLTQEASLTAVADAIRAQTGSTKALTFPADFVAGVENIKKRAAWYRPPDWPDYDSLNLSKDEAYAFFTCDTQAPGSIGKINLEWYFFCYQDSYYRVNVDRGHIENGEFVVDERVAENQYYSHENSDFIIELPQDAGRYISYRVSSIDPTQDVNHVNIRLYDSKNAPRQHQPVVEVFLWQLGAGSVAPIRCGQLTTPYTSLMICKGCDLQGGTSTYWGSGASVPDVIIWDNAGTPNGFGYLPFSALGIKCKYLCITNSALEMVSDAQYQFAAASGLRELDFSGTTITATAMNNCFSECSGLRRLDLSGWDMASVTSMTNAFAKMSALEELVLPSMPSISFSLSDCTALTVDSLVGVIAALPELVEDTTATLTLGDTNTAKLTEEQIAVATEKGWTIA